MSNSETEVSSAEIETNNIKIEALDTSKHNRANFSCGITQVDNFLSRTVNKLTKADNLRTFVTLDQSGDIIGFYSTNAHSVEYSDLPSNFARNRPNHGSIPAAYISMIGVDSRFQRKGYGSILLIDCLKRIVRASESIGIAVVILDVLDCGDEDKVEKRLKLYEDFGFKSLPSQRLRMFFPLKNIIQVLSS